MVPLRIIVLAMQMLVLITRTYSFPLEIIVSEAENCVYCSTKLFAVMHCHDRFSIEDLSGKVTQQTLMQETKILKCFVQSEQEIFLLRDQEIWRIRSNSLKPEQLLYQVDIDDKSNIIIMGEDLFFKPKSGCVLSKLPLKSSGVTVADQQIILDYSAAIGSCTMNFTVYQNENSQTIITYIFDTALLSNITFTENQKNLEEYTIRAALKLPQNPRIGIYANPNFIILSAQSLHSPQLEFMILERGKIGLYKAEEFGPYRGCATNVLFLDDDQFLISFFEKDFKEIFMIYCAKNKNDKFQCERQDIQLDTIFLNDWKITPAGLKLFSSETKVQKTFNLCISQEDCSDSLIQLIENRPDCIKNIKEHELRRSECYWSHLGYLPNCQSICNSTNPFSRCEACLIENYNLPADQCFTIPESHLCDKDNFPWVIPKPKCVKQQKDTEMFTTVVFEIEPATRNCFLDLDFGMNSNLQLKIFAFEADGRTNKGVILSKWIQDLYENANFISIHPQVHYVEMKRSLELFFPISTTVRYKIVLERSSRISQMQMDKIRFCTSCETTLAETSMFGFKNISLIAPEYHYSQKTGLCEQNEGNQEPPLNWHNCLDTASVSYLQFINQSTFCNLNPEKNLITFNDRAKYPFCKVEIDIRTNQSMIIKYDITSYEDIIMVFERKIYSFHKHYMEFHKDLQSRIMEKNGNTSQIHLYFISLEPEETLKSGRAIFIVYNTGSNWGIILAIALPLILVMVYFYRIMERRSHAVPQVISTCPYKSIKLLDGDPKFLEFNKTQVNTLKKLGYKFVSEGTPVSISGRICDICLQPMTDKPYRILLCGVHYTHIQCFKDWIKLRNPSNIPWLCPNRCNTILWDDSPEDTKIIEMSQRDTKGTINYLDHLNNSQVKLTVDEERLQATKGESLQEKLEERKPEVSNPENQEEDLDELDIERMSWGRSLSGDKLLKRPQIYYFT